jgi:hypothetical protein
VFTNLSNLLGWDRSNPSSLWLVKKNGFQLYPYVFRTDERRVPHGDNEIGFDRRIFAGHRLHKATGLLLEALSTAPPFPEVATLPETHEVPGHVKRLAGVEF